MALLELQRINGQRHVLLVRTTLGLVRWVRTVHYGPQYSGHRRYIRRFVSGQQPRQPHELAVPVEHLACSLTWTATTLSRSVPVPAL